jgi:glycosyltransferase involved in cell wall biosynthesis
MQSNQSLVTGAVKSVQFAAVERARVNIAVCGRFHYHNYVRFVDRRGFLNAFYYSHKVSSDAPSLGIGFEQAINCWPKEYLIRAHRMLMRGWLIPECAPLYADLWQISVLKQWRRCDVLHLMLHGAGLKMMRCAKDEGAKVVAEPVNQHPQELNEIMHEEAERLGLKRRRALYRIQERQIEEAAAADFLLAPSRIVRDSFVKRGYEQNRTAVLPYGVDLNRFRPLPNGTGLDRKFRVICVAQVSLRKGQLYLLEAWKKLRLHDAELLLIGAVSYDMNTIMRHYHGMFRHIPFVSNHELRRDYGRSSVFVLPSLEDGCSYVIGEAMACGLPVITTANNGAADIIRDGTDGFVVPIRSSEAIAERLELLYRNDQLREEMSRAALAKARSELSWEKYARRLCALYRWVLEAKRGTDPSTHVEAETAT